MLKETAEKVLPSSTSSLWQLQKLILEERAKRKKSKHDRKQVLYSIENPIFGNMELSEKKLSLIERVMRVRKQEILEQLEDLLIRAEMESRADESLKAIEKNDVVALDDFTKNNQSWIKKKAIK